MNFGKLGGNIIDLNSLSIGDLGSYEFKSHSYSDIIALSNSTLWREFAKAKGEYKESPKYVYAFGTLLDIMLTDREKLKSISCYVSDKNEIVFTIKDDFSRDVCFSLHDFQIACENYNAVFADYPEWNNAEFQKVVEGQIIVDGTTFNTKIKIDAYFERFRTKNGLYLKNTIVDLKSTTASSYEEFLYKVQAYFYKEAGAFYKTTAKADNYVIVAVNRNKKGQIDSCKNIVWELIFTKKDLQEGFNSVENAIRKLHQTNPQILGKYVKT